MKNNKNGKWRSLLGSVGILLLAAGIFALLVATRPETHVVEVKERAWPVAAMEIRPGRWPRTLTLYGRVDALSRTSVTAALAAEVTSVPVEEGEAVREGRLLVVLDDRDYRLDLAQREAELEQAQAAIEEENSRHRGNLEALPGERRLLELAQAEVDRLGDLIRKKLASQSSLDSARQALARQSIAVARIEESVRTHQSKLRELEARLAQKQAALEKARLQLQRTRILAPYAGRVIRVRTAVGQRVSPGTVLLELFAETSMVLRAVVPEVHLAVLREMLEQGGTITATGRLDGRPVRARLLRLGAATTDSGGVEGLFLLEPESRWLQLGRVLELEVELPPLDDVVPIPWEALYGADEVYLINGENRLHAVKVERVGQLRREGRDLLLVRLPGKPEGRLLTTQLPNAVEGLLVKVVRRD